MSKLEEARKIINEVDKQMAELFEKRMQAAKLVAQHKKEMGLPIYDEKREQEVLERNSNFIKDEHLVNYYLQFQKSTMAISRSYQHRLLEGAKIAYSGVEGAFAYIAAKKIFPDGNLVSFKDFQPAYQAVVDGECDYAVLPIENSYAGEVGKVMDLMFNGPLHINGVYNLPVIQNLLGTSDSSLADVRTVVSHSQALSQCDNYIEAHGFKKIEMSNTALAAKKVAEDNDKTLGAIAAKETAALYGLKVLDEHINESSTNTTRFAVFTNSQNRTVNNKENCFILLFTVTNTAGSLAKAIDIIGKYGYNMRVLRSRPMKSLAWEYYFYVEAEGNTDTKEGENMINELKEYCKEIKVVGNYSINHDIYSLKEE